MISVNIFDVGRRPFLSDRAAALNHLGYDARFLAHRHQISRAEAERLIAEIGPDRAKLDMAAKALKQAKL